MHQTAWSIGLRVPRGGSHIKPLVVAIETLGWVGVGGEEVAEVDGGISKAGEGFAEGDEGISVNGGGVAMLGNGLAG